MAGGGSFNIGLAQQAQMQWDLVPFLVDKNAATGGTWHQYTFPLLYMENKKKT